MHPTTTPLQAQPQFQTPDTQNPSTQLRVNETEENKSNQQPQK